MGKQIPFKSKAKPKISVKTPEQKQHDAHLGILNTIVTQTLTRHAGLTEKQFIKHIGFDSKNIDEARAVRIAKFNVLTELSKAAIECTGKANMTTNFLRTYLLENDFAQVEDEENKGETDNA